MNLNMMMYQIKQVMEDEEKTPLERAIICIKRLGKIEKNEVITPESIVKKMINKLPDKLDKDTTILEVNSKYGEFLIGIYQKYGKEIAKNMKVIPSSETTIPFINKIINILELNEYNILDDRYIRDIDGNGKYDVKDFLNLENSEIIDMNNKKKFDICLMNPPYDKNLHLKFMMKTFELINENSGKLIYIGPDSWLINRFSFVEKSKLRNDIRKKYAKYVDDIETYNAEQFNELFGTKNWFGVSIFTMKYNAKGIDPSVYENDDELVNKIIKKISTFTSLRSHFSRRNNSKYFVPVRRTNHGYLNWVEKDVSKNKAKDGILFDNENEMNNFINSFNTWLYQYLNCTNWGGSENSADVPYLDNYTKPWTNEKLYKLFDISDNEKIIIQNAIKEINPWGKNYNEAN